MEDEDERDEEEQDNEEENQDEEPLVSPFCLKRSLVSLLSVYSHMNLEFDDLKRTQKMT